MIKYKRDQLRKDQLRLERNTILADKQWTGKIHSIRTSKDGCLKTKQ